MKRTLLAALPVISTLACSSPDLSTSNAPSCPTGIPFATTEHPDGFTIHAPQLPGWKVREVEGGGGFVFHHFETTEGDNPSFAAATVTAVTFFPAKPPTTPTTPCGSSAPAPPVGSSNHAPTT
ncbi:hypothetical protein ACTWPB_04435 [Nocardia sp. IBHARD005]|uniref:hypothetical protein n=1 Tax=Nocardia sp. IBHARD005 TaxID=3457765 RepID=UPI0040599792